MPGVDARKGGDNMDVVRAANAGTFRKRAKPRRDKKLFSRTAKRVRVENLISNPMRGGIRL